MIANQFICNVPVENKNYVDTPKSNFIGLFLSELNIKKSNIEKIRCLIHYFSKMSKRCNKRYIIFYELKERN